MRKIKPQLFEESPPPGLDKSVRLSLSDWKEVLSRLDQMGAQTAAAQDKINALHTRLINWLIRMKDKIDTLSQENKQLKDNLQTALKQWEQESKRLNPASRKEDQRRTADLMHRHTQFMQGYGSELTALKKSSARNEYHITRLLGELQAVQMEMSLMKRRASAKTPPPPADPPRDHIESLYL